MAVEPSLAQLTALLGRTADDPSIADLHRAHGIEMPPSLTTWDPTWRSDETGGFELEYGAFVRLPGRYPPQRRNGGRGGYLGQLTSAYLTENYAGPVAPGLTTRSTEDEVRARAVETEVDERYGVRRYVVHRDELSTLEAIFRDDGSHVYRLALNERAEDDPELLAAAEQVRAAGPPARAVPMWDLPDPDEPLPAALRALGDYLAANDTLEVDFELRDGWDVKGPSGWTNNPDADREFRIFGHDGTGSLAGFWLVHEGRPVEAQPVVLLESEGTVGPVATDLCDLLYLLSGAVGPTEAVMFDGLPAGEPDPRIARIAETHLERREGRTVEAVIADARHGYSDVEDRVAALNRW